MKGNLEVQQRGLTSVWLFDVSSSDERHIIMAGKKNLNVIKQGETSLDHTPVWY